jgi:hypothetical protein
MDICKQLVDYSMIIRYSITFIVFYILSNNIYNTFVNKNIYLILPILLILLDEIDNIFTIFYKYNNHYNYCTKTFYYQYNDKICDIISYFLLFLFFINLVELLKYINDIIYPCRFCDNKIGYKTIDKLNKHYKYFHNYLQQI